MKLTEREIVTLRECEAKDYSYIARDENGRIYVYKDKPRANVMRGLWMYNGDYKEVDSKLFQMVKWGDDEPTLIEYLLKNSFTKKDLQTGMLLVFESGNIGVVTSIQQEDKVALYVTSLVEDGSSICSYGLLSVYDDNFELNNEELKKLSEYKIVEVYGFPKYLSYEFNTIYSTKGRGLLWQRPQVTELTVEEIEKKLGYKIKIVSNK